MIFYPNQDLRHYRSKCAWWRIEVPQWIINWLLILANILLIASDYIDF